MKIIINKEIKLLFASKFFILLLGIYLLLSFGFVFWYAQFLTVNRADLSSFFYYQPLLQMVFMPIFTMNSFAEEYRQKTIDLLYSMPIASWHMVLAKFLAYSLVMTLAIVTSWVLWAFVNYLGSVDNFLVLSNYFYLLLLTLWHIALGLLISSLNKNPIMGAFFALMAYLLIWSLGSHLSTPYSVYYQGIQGVWTWSSLTLPLFIIGSLWVNYSAIHYRASRVTRTLSPHRLWNYLLPLDTHPTFRSQIQLVTMVVLAVYSLLGGLQSFTNLRLDITRDYQNTFSPLVKEVLRDNKDRLTVYFYLSEDLVKVDPDYYRYALSVYHKWVDLIEPYKDLIQLERVNIKPYESTANNGVVTNYLKPYYASNSDKPYYVGLVLVNGVNKTFSIPLLYRNRQSFIDYDSYFLLKNTLMPKLTKIALISGLPLETGPGGIVEYLNKQSSPSFIYALLNGNYDLVNLNPLSFNWDQLSKQDFDLILVVHPPLNLHEWYNHYIEQFLLKGKPVIVLMDSFSEWVQQHGAKEGLYQFKPFNYSELPLLKAWDIQFNNQDIVIEPNYGVSATQGNNLVFLPNLIHYTRSYFTTPISRNLSQLNLASSGYFTINNKSLTVTPILESSQSSALVRTTDALKLDNLNNYLLLPQVAKPNLLLSAMVTTNYFESRLDYANYPDPNPIRNSQTVGKLLLVGDSDWLDNQWWVSVEANGAANHFANHDIFLMSLITEGLNEKAFGSLLSKAYPSQLDKYNQWLYELLVEKQEKTSLLLIKKRNIDNNLKNTLSKLNELQNDKSNINLDIYLKKFNDLQQLIVELDYQIYNSVFVYEEKIKNLNDSIILFFVIILPLILCLSLILYNQIRKY